MTKTFKQMIADIKKASKRENLVVFIGAGVSANSGYRLWDSLIGLFNEELKYSSKTSQFSTDEMLKIPQYFFNENRDKYYEIIKREYGKLPEQTNPIIDEVLNLKPAHIITTNFDLLIEKSIEEKHIYGNTTYGSLEKYSIIRSDDDFVNALKNHYLIKMHGDVESLDSLVLKENDYLQYSLSHTFIETFIKSLFVNHTILFLGYGLGDYNVKLIISWIEGILQNQEKKKRSSYYFINSDSVPLKEYETKYYRSQNIFVLESSEIPSNFSLPNYNKKAMAFKDIRGNNLIRMCEFIEYGRDNDLIQIKKDLSIFDNIRCMTINELMNKLEMYDKTFFVYDNILEFIKQPSPQIKTIIDILENTDTEALYFGSIFKKAGINSIVLYSSELENKILYLNYKNDELLYNTIIEGNIKKIYELCQILCNDQCEMLQVGYLYLILNETERAIQFLERAISYYKSNNNIFNMLICYQNISNAKFEKPIWHTIFNNLSEEDKINYRTLYNYLDGSNELYQNTVEVYRQLQQKFDVNNFTINSDKDNLSFLKLRYSIHQIQKYFIINNIYIRGFSQYMCIIGKWIKSVEIYVELLLILHGSNMKMHRGNTFYHRNSLLKEDIYILVYYPKNSDLIYMLKKYNIIKISVDEGCTNYIITLLNNYINAFEFEKVLGFKFANDIINILSIIKVVDFRSEQYSMIFQSFTNLFEKMMTTFFVNKKYCSLVFNEVPDEILDCIFFLINNRKEFIQVESLKKLMENVLLCFINTSGKDNIGISILGDHGTLLNLCIALKNNFEDSLSERVTNDFLEIIQDKYPSRLSSFIIELFPILLEEQKEKWRPYVSISEIRADYIRFGIINSVFYYNDEICTILINRCRHQITEKASIKYKDLHLKPLYSVLRLVEKDIINDLEPYREFLGYFDLFDYVCFPNEFDYSKYDTSWGSWLTLEKYKEPALKIAYEILKKKYQLAMEDGPSEIEKLIYYKYFY